MHFPEVKYYLINPIKGRYKLIFEPLNWDEDEKKLVRNETNWGVFTELSNNLQFVKDGKDYINEVYETQGTEAELILERYVAKETNKGYELDYKGFLDLKTYQLDDEKISVKFLSGGLQSIIESQFDEAYELERGTDINGNQITALDYDTIFWEGRRVFLESLLNTPEDNNNQLIQNFTNLFNQCNNFLMNIEYSSDDNVQSPLDTDEFFEVDLNDTASISNFFYVTDVQKTVKFTYKYDFTITDLSYNELKGAAINLRHAIYKYDVQNAQFTQNFPISDENIFNIFDDFINNNNIDNLIGQRIQGESIIEEDLPANSVVFFGLINNIRQIDFATTPFLEILTNNNNSVLIEENSEFEPTSFDAIKLYDAYNRMLEIYTGQRDKIISDYFKNSQFKDVLLSSGRQIRNLPDARLSVELKDLYETNNYFNLGWSVEKINQTEYFVVEPKRYFFQNTVAIDLGEVSNLKISCKSDLLFKSMQFGNKKAGDYEEVQGLQEYNALTTYVSHLKTSDTKYEVAADIRADLVGAELARRKNYKVAPNEDTRYDNENFLFNCKPYETDKFTPKVWQDVLDAEPIVYDPPTAGNLLLTPFRSMQRHSNVFNAGMKVYQDKFTRYSTGSGEVNVITKLENEPAYAENSDIINSELETPIFEAVEYQFNKPISLEINKMLRGKQNINGRKIPNVNFLVKFAYKGEKYTGYILEVSYNGEGEWKLIKNFN